mmetsp:Transcript_20816/g.33519  ORF Transcript_20816/g.33519 Transcript_20816/m.33519 type:complete len:146 (+) Transcript_20816:1783-2220(+)
MQDGPSISFARRHRHRAPPPPPKPRKSVKTARVWVVIKPPRRASEEGVAAATTIAAAGPAIRVMIRLGRRKRKGLAPSLLSRRSKSGTGRLEISEERAAIRTLCWNAKCVRRCVWRQASKASLASLQCEENRCEAEAHHRTHLIN